MTGKINNVTQLRSDNHLLQNCRMRLRRKIRGLGLFLVKTTTPDLQFKPLTTIEPDPLTKQRMEEIRQDKLEARKRIDQQPIATNINRLKTPRRKNQFPVPSTPGPEAA